MNITGLFIRRPIMTTLVMMAILLFGIMGYRNLPVSDLPSVDFPTIMVMAALPGASAETMASAVATPLERQFSTIAGLDSMTSSSSLGTTRITLQFALNRNIDAAAQDVQTAMAQAARTLPDMPTPPFFRKVNPADAPILFISMNSLTLPLSRVNEYAESFVSPRISMVSGVAQVDIWGAQKYAVRAQLNPQALASKSIGIDEVSGAVQKQNVNLPTGTLNGEKRMLTIKANGQLINADAYRPLIVTYRNGSPVRLQDLGTVIDSVENDKTASWYNDSRTIMLAINRQPGTNTIEVVDAIKKLLPELRALIPASVNLDVTYDRSVSIRDSVGDVKVTLFISLCLVVLVIFIFLRNLSATVIPSLALPMSIIGTFAVMYLMDYSIDNLSLMALTLSVGFVVDDAIVMLENIVRHREMGKGMLAAAVEGSKEIGFTILSMTLSLAAVFIPILFMGGIIGRLLHEFAVVIGMAVLVSGFVSLTLTPMLCSRFLKPSAQAHHGRLYAFSDRVFNGMFNIYKRTLSTALSWPGTVMIVAGLILIATVFFFFITPMGFLPNEDTGQIQGNTEAEQGTSFKGMVEYHQALGTILRKEPGVRSVQSDVGAMGSRAGNNGRVTLFLKPRSERHFSPDDIIQKLRPKLASIPGLRVFLQVPPPIRIGGYGGKAQYQVAFQSPDTTELYRNASIMETKMRQMPDLQDVSSDLQIKNPEINLDIDRDRASTLGITAQQIEGALSTAYSGQQISTILAPNNQYQVIIELDPKYQSDPSAFSFLYIRSSQGKLVPLNTLINPRHGAGPMSVNHLGQIPSVTISFNIKPGVALGDAIDAIQKTARSALPPGITTSFQGTAQAFQDSQKGLPILILMTIIVIYIILGILYESFIHPLTILSGLPSAGFGALLTLLIFHKELSLYGFVGLIMLIGIVKKNAIMMIDFALDAQRTGGKKPAEAIYEGCLVRFRPIMMTSMAALMGTLPIALGFGAGAESRRPLGLAVVGGLIFSQLITLYITPVVYVYLDRFQHWLGRTFRKDSKHGNVAPVSP
jgi:hydrophobic/amphiphilic exporter-1 (mainly G- bacteria), HAE1 family